MGSLGQTGQDNDDPLLCWRSAHSGSLPAARSRHLKKTPQVIGRVGSVVETPTFFPRMSRRKKPRPSWRPCRHRFEKGGRGSDYVGLGPRKNDQVRTYSLGMKQRLGLGSALLKDPDVLILDEPANGLDPAGIKEVRELLSDLGEQGKTVFVSSHILAEVAQTCDRVAILQRETRYLGRRFGDPRPSRPSELLVRIRDTQAAADALTAAAFQTTVGEDALRVSVPPTEAERITRTSGRRRSLPVRAATRPGGSRNRAFLELTRDPGAPAVNALPRPRVGPPSTAEARAHPDVVVSVAGMLVASAIVLFQSNRPDEQMQRRIDRQEQRKEACLAGEVRFPKWVNLENPEIDRGILQVQRSDNPGSPIPIPKHAKHPRGSQRSVVRTRPSHRCLVHRRRVALGKHRHDPHVGITSRISLSCQGGRAVYLGICRGRSRCR